LFICRGRILAAGPLDQIRAMLDDHPLKVRITTPRARQLATRLLELDTVHTVEIRAADELLLQVRRPKDFFGPLADVITRDGFDVERLRVIDASTEAVFEYLMQAASRPR
jgi:hypothetical protein